MTVPALTDIYPLSQSAELDPDLFRSPGAEYRAAPLWAWNTRLETAQLMRQIDVFKQMGMGGFHIHPRTGLATEYLGEDFMTAARACVDKARSEGMLTWLYDEDRWPSGFAGGLVTRDERHQAMRLIWTMQPRNSLLLEAYNVVLKDGVLDEYSRIVASGIDTKPQSAVWLAYLEIEDASPWFGNAAYVNTLSPAAIRRFLAVTHERYAAIVGDEFGRVIPAIFTDEPQFVYKSWFTSPEDRSDLRMPFTSDLFESYAAAYGERLEESLPELFWELPDGRASRTRYRYHDHVCGRFTEAFADQVGAWCSEHGLALTGHMMEESTLLKQSRALGEAMRSYRAFALPGIDMLCDAREYNTAKQAQSAARQFGRPGMTSEMYGVTNWDFPFAGHKSQGDWQAALGVTVRVPHLAWVSMAGESKRDYPASIGIQSPWAGEYPLIEDHFARVNTVLTRGAALARVGVIHPVESYWLCLGPMRQTARERDEREAQFADLTNWLIAGMIDFDFIAESLLPQLCADLDWTDATLPVGAMRYDVVLVPNLRTIRSGTLERLRRCQANGGRVIVLGDFPTLVDAEPDQALATLPFELIPFQRARLLEALDAWPEIAAETLDGEPVDWLAHQIRMDGHRRFVFVCNTRASEQPESYRAHRHPVSGAPMPAPIRLLFKGAWVLREMDTLTGEIRPLSSRLTRRESGGGAWTEIVQKLPRAASLLVELNPRGDGEADTCEIAPLSEYRETGRIAGPVPVTLSEPNVLLLDQARYRFDGGEWQGPEELLRIENLCRRHYGLPDKHGEIAQPWTDPRSAEPLGQLSLRFEIQSMIAVAQLQLALEQPEGANITVNGRFVDSGADAITGHFVDEAIKTVAVPGFSAGLTMIEISRVFTHKTDVEWCYLLGDFGVEARGHDPVITAPVRELAWGDWTRQGLPFYAGNVTYHCTLTETESAEHGDPVWLRVPFFTNPLLSADSNGTNIAKIAFPPYRAALPNALAENQIDLTAYGNRHNAFGALHNCNASLHWFGPSAWRSTGAEWSYEYQLKQMGILVAPMLERRVEEQS